MDLRKLPVAGSTLPQGKPVHLMSTGTLEESKTQRKKNENEGLVGFVNIGNSCYMNATLQALSNCPPFCQYFVDSLQSSSSQSAAGVLSTLLKKVWSADRHSGHLSPRVVSLAMKNRMFKGSQQHDAQEFLRCLLTQIHDEIGIQVPPAEEWPHGYGHMSCYRDSMLSCDSDTSADSHSSQSRLVSPGRNSSPPTNKRSPSLSCIKLPGSAHNSPTTQSKFSLKYTKILGNSSVKTSSENILLQVKGSGGTHLEEVRGSMEPPEVKNLLSENDLLVADLIERKVTIHKNYFKSSLSCKRASEDVSCDRESANKIIFSDNVSPSGTEPSTSLVPGDLNESERKGLEQRHDLSVGQGAGKDMECVELKVINSPPDSGVNLTQLSSSPVPLSPHHNKPGHSQVPRTTSIVSEIFEGILESRVKCLACKKISVIREPFQDLSLPIPGRKEIAKFNSKTEDSEGENHKSHEEEKEEGRGSNISRGLCTVWNLMTSLTRDLLLGPPTNISDCLNAFFGPSELKGDNKYNCSHCKSLQNSVKMMSIVKLPEVLCIHLKRFRFDAYFSTKISRHIQFPLKDLDMGPYLKQKDQLGCTYDLNTIITHYGGAAGGHYVAFAKTRYRNSWYEFNDTRVHPVSIETVQNAEGYVLFYRRNLPNESLAMQTLDITALLPPSGTTLPSPNVCYISRHWLHLLKHCGNPGPIFQFDFACRHGAVHPTRTQDEARSLALTIRKDIWDAFHQQYGGGPFVERLEICARCKELLNHLNERRKAEKEMIHQMQAREKRTEKTEPYLLSMEWLQQWQKFIHCTTLEFKPPLAIDNGPLLQQQSDGIVLAEGALFRKVSPAVWDFFHRTYGGGPVIVTNLELICNSSDSGTN